MRDATEPRAGRDSGKGGLPTRQGPGGGTYTFKTNGHRGYSWQDGYGLPRYGDDQQSCLARAVEEANGYFTNYFQMPAGTEVTVRYRCD